jgi:hypothetical protein
MGFLLLVAPGRAGLRAVLHFSNKSKQFSKAGQPGGRYSRLHLQSLLIICTTVLVQSRTVQRLTAHAAVGSSAQS